MESFSKFRLPIGSLAVDATLVFFIAWWGSGVTQALETLDSRMDAREQVQVLPGTAVRLASLETRVDRADKDRDEILSALKRIEDKIDRKADR